MKQQTKNILFAIVIMVAVWAFSFSAGTVSVQGQEKDAAKPTRTRSNQAGRDPFSRYIPPRAPVKSTGLVVPPSIQDRITQYKAQKQSAMIARVVAPKPTTAFLLSEMQVVGISRTPRGYAAIVEATPIKLSYVIYPGERFFDGQLVAIEDNRLIFRREIVYTDGRHERSVEIKPLRQANPAEEMSATKTAAPASTAITPEKSSEQKPAADKP